MHRRARHLNPGSTGAVLALDSRFISGLNDGDAVATWEDRTNNNNDATQGNSARRPIYKTAQQGGQPIVRFSKASTQYLLTGNGPFGIVTNGFGIALFSKNSASNFGTAFNHGNFSNFAGSTYEFVFTENNRKIQSLAASGSGGSVALDPTAQAQNTMAIASSKVAASGPINLKVNGISVATGSNLSGNLNNTTTPIGIGARGSGTQGTSDCLDGDIACIVYSGQDVNETLRKRLEHAAAFSFKIACS